MMLILVGAVNYITGGTPLGNLPANFRMFGRDAINNFPVLGTLPNSIVVLFVTGLLLYWLLQRSNFGKRIYAVGGNSRAADLAGIDVAGTKTLAFVVSALSAVVAGILLGGYAGVSVNVGNGYEFQAISAAVIGRSGPHRWSGHSSRGNCRRSHDAGAVRAVERARVSARASGHGRGRHRHRGRRIWFLPASQCQVERRLVVKDSRFL